MPVLKPTSSKRLAVVAASIAVAVVGVLAIGGPPAWSAASHNPCPTFCGRQGAPLLIALSGLRRNTAEIVVFSNQRGPFELVITRSRGGRLVGARPTLISRSPQGILAGSVPVRDRRVVVARIRLRPLQGGVRSRGFRLRASGRALAPGTYIVQPELVTRAGRLRARGASIVVRLTRGGQFVYLLQLHTAPGAATGAAGSVAQTTGTLYGNATPYGQATSYYFQYGPTSGYGEQTPTTTTSSTRKVTTVLATLNGLSLATTYHYRLVSTDCGGCRYGTSYGADKKFTTLGGTGLSPQQLYADRAVATYNAMQSYFYAPSVYPGDASSLYAENFPQSGLRYSYLWPFSRALVGTITLAGIPAPLLSGASYQAAVNDRLTGLSHYWDASSTGPGYDSYPPPPYGTGGDKYYDDQAWVGLALAQNYQLTGSPSSLAGAENVFNFVYPGGLAATASTDPGGVYWVQQGIGTGQTNHSRTTNSTVPNAELALLLAGFDPANAATYEAAAGNLYEWANHYLYNVNVNPTDPAGPNPNFDPSQPALMFDNIGNNGKADETLWTYNQGAMIAANVREYVKTGQPAYLDNAAAIANTALSIFSESEYLDDQPAAFNAIFFRGLLVLYWATSDTALRTRITQTIETYANDAWNYYRNAQGLFQFPSSSGSGYQLLDQGAMLQIYAMLAWNPSQYSELP